MRWRKNTRRGEKGERETGGKGEKKGMDGETIEGNNLMKRKRFMKDEGDK